LKATFSYFVFEFRIHILNSNTEQWLFLFRGDKRAKSSFEVQMSQLQGQPTLVEQVVNAIVSEIVDGDLPSNARLIQDELAKAYGVSRQPVQQALLLLRDRGLVREAPGRGLIVSPLDVGFVRNLYEIRAVLDGLAARLAAERGAERAKAEGPAFLELGRVAVDSGSLHDQIEADMKFHGFLNELSSNPLIGETTAPHWPYLRRVMGEVLRDDVQMPQTILQEHVAILDAVIAGDGARAEMLSRNHISRAADIFVQRLEARHAASEEQLRQRRTRRIQR
jgi:DNA-binding GntR family transcriptional regulator